MQLQFYSDMRHKYDLKTNTTYIGANTDHEIMGNTKQERNKYGHSSHLPFDGQQLGAGRVVC